jgi:hypothetical protein
MTYFAVLFLVVGCSPVAFAVGSGDVGPQTLIMIVPVVAAIFIARWATIVDARGITVRAAFGKTRLGWDEIRGLSVDGRSVYAVTPDGSWRLPCVHVANLAELSRASGGRLPAIADPKPKFAPPHRRRR